MPAYSFGDYEKLNEENRGLRRELEASNQAVEALREREAALSYLMSEECHGCETMEALQKYLSPSQPSRYQFMEAVVEAAREFESDCSQYEKPDSILWMKLRQTLAAYDKAREAPTHD